MNDLDKERKRWEKWNKSLELYAKAVKGLKKFEKDLDDKKYTKLRDKIDDQYSATKLFLGPFTIITDLNILTNPNIILPGDTKPFGVGREWSFSVVQRALGKTVKSEIRGYSGKVIGYSYDAGDDYLVIKTESGEIKHMIMNAPFTIIDKKEEEN